MIAVIDYGVGNLFSVEKALTYVGAEVEVTHDAKRSRRQTDAFCQAWAPLATA